MYDAENSMGYTSISLSTEWWAGQAISPDPLPMPAEPVRSHQPDTGRRKDRTLYLAGYGGESVHRRFYTAGTPRKMDQSLTLLELAHFQSASTFR